MCVVGLQIALGIYYLVHIYDSSLYAVLGNGLVVAKGAAGVLYPSLALVLLSSSRRLGTVLRGWGWPSRFINWDRSQVFHIVLGWTILVAATIHGLAHLSGTFVQAADHPTDPLLAQHGFPVPISYSKMVATRAGIAGILSLAILFAIVATAHGRVRRHYFNVFQLTHLLVFAFVVTLLVHSSQGLIQSPVLGYWLIVPMLVVLWDRLGRAYQMANKVPGVTVRLSSNSLCIITIPVQSVPWKYSPGQYVLLRCSEVSWWEWHPFTIVGVSRQDTAGPDAADAGQVTAIEIYMKVSGDWTQRLYTRCERSETLTFNVDGAFGSPAAAMSDFDHLIVIGANVGITPYAGWVSALGDKQIMDLHWIVRDRSAFEWFSDLLNETRRGSLSVHTYVTAQPAQSPVTYACRYLIEGYRTVSQPRSLITGLDCQTRFGRPNLESVFTTAIARLPEGFKGRVGVFFCGPNYLGMEISDRCSLERVRSGLRWEFKGEVF
jgi:predicted ferric reductase